MFWLAYVMDCSQVCRTKFTMTLDEDITQVMPCLYEGFTGRVSLILGMALCIYSLCICTSTEICPNRHAAAAHQLKCAHYTHPWTNLLIHPLHQSYCAPLQSEELQVPEHTGHHGPMRHVSIHGPQQHDLIIPWSFNGALGCLSSRFFSDSLQNFSLPPTRKMLIIITPTWQPSH